MQLIPAQTRARTCCRLVVHALRVWLGLLLACALIGAQAANAENEAALLLREQHIAQQKPARPFMSVPLAERVTFGTVTLAELGDQVRRLDASGEGMLAVVYPDLGEPFRGVFEQIISGIESRSRLTVRSFAVGSSVDPVDLNAQLRRLGVRAVIALGREGLRAVSAIERDIPLVVGGVLAVPSVLTTGDADSRSVAGVSLTPDPNLLFARLKSLLPGVKRVTVVYNPQRNDWLIKLARDAARLHGLELVAHEASDLASAVRLYETAFASSDGRRDAVWLPQDTTTVDENTVLPLVLRESWNRGVPVFSSSFLHAKKGALFALYPDNVELGRTLASSAEAALAGGPRRRSVLPLRDVQIAVNLRTASHLGLNLGYQQQRNFDLTFPEP